MKKYLINTSGCQANELDSEKISWVLDTIGYEPTEDKEQADIILFNTCAVRKSAEDKVFGQLGELKELKRRKPNVVLGICGCMMQREDIREFFLSKHKHIDLVFGTNNIHKLPQLISRQLETGQTIIDIVEDTREIDESIDAHRKYSYKAYVDIMYGCDNYCTYCIVPYTRGRERSREPKVILDEVKKLVQSGVKEVTLLGQNVNSYGRTLSVDYSFPDLLREINEIDGIQRIRFMTSHPKDFTHELIKAYMDLDKLSPHLHLPVQSGSNRMLKLMNRKYTRDEYLEKIKTIKNLVPNIAITTDIIVGFPGETEQDFQETLDLVKEVEFDLAYTFLYSIREGTTAAKMEKQVPDKIKHERFQRLLDTLNPIGLKLNQKLLGTVQKVLVEAVSKNDNEVMSGRTGSAKLVHFKGGEELIGKIVSVRIDNVKTFTLEGIMID
ncbi:tRNA (N6-isopentenyl adenosine(37)-C2)-methylthiotransferase MiaB [Gudongella sp. DL1XJH-153]|uniref:tRNA (N6-isopentenyl adenosine(37)-C2)-methylthiotransferase MiaB n=1 Tax=Gudongella sp. DL1XJH-153 TaxID=3409804 RepID=UPI003BB80B6C